MIQKVLVPLMVLLLIFSSCEKSTNEGEDQFSAYITKVLDYMPAPGQFTNLLPEYEEGDTQEIMNQKVLESIGNGAKSAISLGGYGGYVVVGFDHTIQNIEGLRDFRISGNAYSSEQESTGAEGGSCEAGIIMVAYDANKNGVPDDDEWYEIAGSSHVDPSQEAWYDAAVAAACDVNFYSDYQIIYSRPESEPETSDYSTYISWSDNKGGEGYIPKNSYHTQSYFPQWIDSDELILSASRLPQNGIATDGNPYNTVLYRFEYGYADNYSNSDDESAIDIAWAVDTQGNSVELEGVDFIKIYTGVNQLNNWLGECSTEISNVEDLHILGVQIPTR